MVQFRDALPRRRRWLRVLIWPAVLGIVTLMAGAALDFAGIKILWLQSAGLLILPWLVLWFSTMMAAQDIEQASRERIDRLELYTLAGVATAIDRSRYRIVVVIVAVIFAAALAIVPSN